MKQVKITHIGGVELSSPVTLALEPEKIVTTETVEGACEIVYAETIDRRVQPKVYRTGNTKAQIDGYVTGTQIDFTVYNQADGSTRTVTVQEKFVEDMQSGTLWIYSSETEQAGVKVRFEEGAYLTREIFVSGSIGDFATAALTTTTSTTAAATTTTTAAATTTTTAAATTTTTAAATTTTTAAVTTTTTTGA